MIYVTNFKRWIRLISIIFLFHLLLLDLLKINIFFLNDFVYV